MLAYLMFWRQIIVLAASLQCNFIGEGMPRMAFRVSYPINPHLLDEYDT